MITRNHSLKNLNSFGFSIKASMFTTPTTTEELRSLIASGILREHRTKVLGGGSNILFLNDFEGVIIHPQMKGIEAKVQEDGAVMVNAGAGVVWDDFVGWTVSNGFWGAENLSLIPGHTGASAVQNIGAYGTEVAEIIQNVFCTDLATGEDYIFSCNECAFGYRDSIFKGEWKEKFLITNISFNLSTQKRINLEYGALKEETQKLGGQTLSNIRTAVINIRRSKLPDPGEIGNCGSFFKNPIVSPGIADELKTEYPKIPCYDTGDGKIKIAAGWLIEQCGWKGFRRNDAGVYEKQALVLVNYGNASGNQIIELACEIAESVSNRFGIALEREVEVI